MNYTKIIRTNIVSFNPGNSWRISYHEGRQIRMRVWMKYPSPKALHVIITHPQNYHNPWTSLNNDNIWCCNEKGTWKSFIGYGYVCCKTKNHTNMFEAFPHKSSNDQRTSEFFYNSVRQNRCDFWENIQTAYCKGSDSCKMLLWNLPYLP